MAYSTEQEQLAYNVVRKARAADTNNLLSGMSDSQIYHFLKGNRFTQVRDLPYYPPNSMIYEDVYRQYSPPPTGPTHDPNLPTIDGKEHEHPGFDPEDTKDNRHNIAGQILGLGGIVDNLGIVGEIYKGGINESFLIGGASHLLFGEAPFRLSGDAHQDRTDQTGWGWNRFSELAQDAAELGVALAIDSSMIAAMATVGPGVALVNVLARTKAAQKVGRMLFREAMEEGVEQGIIKVGKTDLVKSIATKSIKEGEEVLLKRVGTKAEREFIKGRANDSRLMGEAKVATMISSRESVLANLKPYEFEGKKILDAPSLLRIMGHGGIAAGKGLSGYNIAQDWRHQVTEDIQRKYPGYDAPDIVERYLNGDSILIPEAGYDIKRSAHAAMEGLFGGIIAGGLGNIIMAGKLGGLANKSAAAKYLRDHSPRAEALIFSNASKVVGEAAGFTMVSEGLEKVFPEHDSGIPWGEKYLENLVTFGVLNATGALAGKWKEHRQDAKMRLKSLALQKEGAEAGNISGAAKNIKIETEADARVSKGLAEMSSKAANERWSKRDAEIKNITKDIDEITDKVVYKDGKYVENNMLADDAFLLRNKIKRLMEITEEMVSKEGAITPEMKKIWENPFFDEAAASIRGKNNLFTKMEKEILERERGTTDDFNKRDGKEVLSDAEPFAALIDKILEAKKVYGVKGFGEKVRYSKEEHKLYEKYKTQIEKILLDRQVKKKWGATEALANHMGVELSNKDGKSRTEQAFENLVDNQKKIEIEKEGLREAKEDKKFNPKTGLDYQGRPETDYGTRNRVKEEQDRVDRHTGKWDKVAEVREIRKEREVDTRESDAKFVEEKVNHDILTKESGGDSLFESVNTVLGKKKADAIHSGVGLRTSVHKKDINTDIINRQVKRAYVNHLMDSQVTGIDVSMRHLNNLAKFIDHQGRNLLELKHSDIQSYLDTGGPGGRSWGATSARTNMNHLNAMMVKIMRASKEKVWSGTKPATFRISKDARRPLSVVEKEKTSVDVVTGEIEAQKSYQNYMAETLKSKDYREVPTDDVKLNKSGSKVADTDTLHLVGYILGFHGRRKAAIYQPQTKGQHPIRMMDIHWGKATEDKPSQFAVIYVKDKNNPNKNLRHNIIFVADMIMPNGVNYFKTLQRLYDRRATEIAGGVTAATSSIEPLFVARAGTGSKKGSPVDIKRGLTADNLNKLAVKYYGDKLEGDVHSLRKLWGTIASGIDHAVGGKYWSKFFSEKISQWQSVHRSVPKTAEEWYGYTQGGLDIISDLQKFHVMAKKWTELQEHHAVKLKKGYGIDARNDANAEFASWSDRLLNKRDTSFLKEQIKLLGRESSTQRLSQRQGKTEKVTSKSFQEGLTKELAGREGGKKQKVGILSDMPPLRAKALREIVVQGIKNNPGLVAWINKVGTKDAGKFVDGIIYLTEGKADATTFFHENVHRLESFITMTHNKKMLNMWKRGERHIEDWALKNDKERWFRFLGEYKTREKAANEYLTQLSAEWSVKRMNATGLGKFGVWIKQVVSAIKNFLGFGTPKDVAKTFGKIGERGFSTEGHVFNVHKRQAYSSSNPLREDQKVRLRQLTRERMEDYDISIPQLLIKEGALEGRVIYDPQAGRFKDISGDIPLDITEGQATYLIDFITESVPSPSKGKSKLWNSLNASAHLLERQRGMKIDQREKIKKILGIPKVSLKYASQNQLQRYIEFVKKYGQKYSEIEPVIDASMGRELALQKGFKQLMGRTMKYYTMPEFYVMEKLGGPGAKKVADALLEHYRIETEHAGKASVFVYNAQKQVGKKQMKHIPFALDPQLVMDKGVKNPFLPKGTEQFIEKAKIKNSKEYKAVKEIKAMYKYYWDTMRGEARAKISNPAEWEKFNNEMNSKFVENYFTRVLTPEALEYFQIGSSGYNDGIKKLSNDIVEMRTAEGRKTVAKLEEALSNILPKHKDWRSTQKKLKEALKTQEELSKSLHDPSSVEGQRVLQEATDQMYNLLHRRRNQVNNKFMLPRTGFLGNTVDIGSGKKIQVWEHSFDKVAGQYIRVMSSFLATLNTFPEFTSVSGRSSGVAGRILTELSRSGDLGKYIDKAFRRQIGLEEVDTTNQMVTRVFEKAGRYSALFGLSSPLSGIKNLYIGTHMTMGVHGLFPFLYGTMKLLSPSARLKVKKIGATQVGTKELEIVSRQAFWMKYVSGMTPSEIINRVIGSYAGLYTARGMVDRLRGRGFALFPKMRAAKALRELEHKFHFNEKDLADAQRYGLDKVKGDSPVAKGINKRIEQLENKIMHYSHIMSQGSTGDPFLPYWASGKNAKAMTLFYRMAYSGTYNTFEHIYKPLTKGNPLPLIRQMAAGYVLGGSLWSLYHNILGSPPPKENEELSNQIGQNLAKVETLGLFSFLISPYNAPGEFGFLKHTSESLLWPQIINNFSRTWELVASLFNPEDKNVVGSVEKWITDTVVLANHGKKAADKLFKKNRTQFKTNRDKLNTWKSAWLKKSGFWDEYNYGIGRDRNNPFGEFSENRAYYNLIKHHFMNGDLDAAADAYIATWYYVYDSKRVLNGKMQLLKTAKAAQRDTDSALRNVIEKINPLKMDSKRSAGKLISMENLFFGGGKFVEGKGYLSKENQLMAKKWNANYWRKQRQLKDKINQKWAKFGGAYKRGEIFDAFRFGVPFKTNFFGAPVEREDSYKRSDLGKALDL